MSKATGVMDKRSECGQHGYRSGLAEAQAGRTLTVLGNGGLHNQFDAFLGEMAIVTDTLNVQQTRGCIAFRPSWLIRFTRLETASPDFRPERRAAT